ncbi:DUF302 domain-containing protein [Actinomycetospora callitridis]|uniref:DUF302 domain-containing protein n=1 Tax=Actinomycetospora callitridis TaxID=913944 RepID=UPI002366E11F|nr:DUF302 domain-containing protein [Actinomycetospora callitridis]MDD7918772.1 DUF302 domain-containing protein [Actinomycetospora callitridis]
MAGRLVVVEAERDVASVVARLERALEEAGIAVFARIDHAAAARAAGLELPDEVVLVFGDPAVGTRLMQADPRVGHDLPLRLLVWEQPGGRTALGYRDPRGLDVDPAAEPVPTILDRMHGLLERLAHDAAAPGGTDR